LSATGSVVGIASRQLIIGTALLWLAGCANQPPAPPTPAPARPAEPPPDAPSPPTALELAAARARALACQRIAVVAVGDIMLGTDFPAPRLPPDDGVEQLSAAAPILQQADIAFGNLEGVLLDGGEPAKTCRDPAACYLFRSPPRFADTLATAGFTVLSLANNHARDFGEEGRDATMAALSQAGIRHSGREGTVASWELGDVRVAMIAFAPFKGAWPMLDPVGADAAVAGLAAGHDIVIVSFHGGGEGGDAQRIPFTEEFYRGENRGNVVEFARSMVDAGADVVIGHGPHVPRAMEFYHGRLVAYSLGNFATWWGINVKDDKGLAPILRVVLDGNGRLIDGSIVSMRQIRPDGPRADPTGRAGALMRELTVLDFGGGNLRFTANDRLEPVGDTGPACEAMP
jgi:poly-gamma-glutamate capsule biosynthesis protein CapA/YwtB (metallophosphatase superfamily)